MLLDTLIENEKSASLLDNFIPEGKNLLARQIAKLMKNDLN